MKRYYVKYWNNFSNTYSLYWAETPEQIEKAEKCDYERINRKEAEKLCAGENYRKKYDSTFSGYSSNVIFPIDYDGTNWMDDGRMYKNGYTIEYSVK